MHQKFAVSELVARRQLAKDALAAHARDELGISDVTAARPNQAAFTSAFSFSIGAVLPLATAMIMPSTFLVPTIAISSLLFLAILGIASAMIGGAPILKAAIRVTFWGGLAMGITATVGTLFASHI